MVDSQDIASNASSADSLLDKALAAGGCDNTSIVVVKFLACAWYGEGAVSPMVTSLFCVRQSEDASPTKVTIVSAASSLYPLNLLAG